MFKLKSPFKPTGDQPQAIEKLTKNLKAGVKHQVLLGVTGSGKSVLGETPVFVKRNGETICRLIGQLIDSLFQKYSQKIIQLKESEILSVNQLEIEDKFEVFSLNPKTKQSEWKPVLQLIRHPSPKALYRVKTACGREVTITGDHNFWVLRDGKFVLLPTNQLKTPDYIPLPRKIPGPEKDLSHLDIFKILEGENLYVDARPFILKALTEKGPREIIKAMGEYYAFPSRKLYQIKTEGRRGSSLPLETFCQLAQKLEVDFFLENLNRIVVGPNIYRYTLPVKLPISKELLELFGYYLSEGTSLLKSEYFQIANPHPFLQRKIKHVLKKLKLHCSPSENILYIGSKIHTILFDKLMGRNAFSKKLPEFWPSLSNDQLGTLLRAYFDGDGGAFPDEARVAAITISKKLAFDLGYALLRFGIWARISKSRRKTKDAWEIVISGKENLLKFKHYIGFDLPEKQERLKETIRKAKKSKMDIIPTMNKILKNWRVSLKISQQYLANFSGTSRSNISAIEVGRSNPHRKTFEKIINSLNSVEAEGQEKVRLDENLKTFLNCRWTEIDEIEKINSENTYVYDFGVKDNETFLAGFGGLFMHNTFTTAKVIENIQKPTLVIVMNKTLAAQLFQEFREFFPGAGIHFFTSYYDYYQPEAYIPQTDTYIEKDAKINEEIDRLRHAATQDLLTRNDIIIVASVSCIYNIGSPEAYRQVSLEIKTNQKIKRKDLLSYLTSLQYQRNDIDFRPGTFRVRGNIIEIFAVTGREIFRIEFDGDKIENLTKKEILGKNFEISNFEFRISNLKLYPAHFWVTPQEKLGIAIENIKLELQEQLKKLKKQKKLLETQRLEQRTNYDLEMLKETGYCHGIENYSRHLEFRKPGEAPYALVDYFPEDFLIFIDESHMTLPQLHAMANQDRARKETLIEYGFRLPSAIDNRPLTFGEFAEAPLHLTPRLSSSAFEERAPQVVYVSATPAEEEREKAGKRYIVEQLIRPTGLLEPSVEIRPTKNQVKDLIAEIKKQVTKKQRVLVLTLTKRLAEALSDYLSEEGISCQWLHSEVKTLERPQILKDLREGKYDVLVGINLLREGLDLPEVALVAILDADKEGFLRSETTLIQTMGRAARHQEGHVILYADKITLSMKKAIEEVLRRKKIQEKYNKVHQITPEPIVKPIREWPFAVREKEIASEFWMIRDERLLEKEMKEAAKNLDFERAAEIRDLIKKLKNGKDKSYVSGY